MDLILFYLSNGWRLCYPNEFNIVLSAVDFEGSYGHGRGLIEIMGLLTLEERAVDDVIGNQTAEQVYERILRHYESDYVDPFELLSENESGTEDGEVDPSISDLGYGFEKFTDMLKDVLKPYLTFDKWEG